MLNNVNLVDKKILVIIVIFGLLSSTFLAYGYIWAPLRTKHEPLPYINYYYQPHVPKEGQRTVCIVFDDGWLTQYTTALPILDEYGFKATFAIITDNPDKRPAYMSWNQIITLHNQGHDIESHTVNHLALDQLNATAIEYQLSQSKQDLLKHGINTPLVIYPRGKGIENPDVEKLVQQYYLGALSINHGSLDMSQTFNPYALPSYAITNATTMETFKRYVDQANSSTIVIIYYHDISNISASTTVTPEDFAAQMQYLYDNGFTVQTLKQLFTSVE